MKLQTIQLPQPQINEGLTVMEALSARHTSREFSPRQLSLEHLSEVLWAAYGINRPDGKRTAPAAWGVYGLDLYAVTPAGIYHYRPAEMLLEPVAEGDFRNECGMQDYVFSAPLNIVFFADYSRMRLDDVRFDTMLQQMLPVVAALDGGAGIENVYLYCASAGINCVERLLLDEDKFRKVAGLPQTHHFVIAATLGYPADKA